jgi:hypothetical protein
MVYFCKAVELLISEELFKVQRSECTSCITDAVTPATVTDGDGSSKETEVNVPNEAKRLLKTKGNIFSTGRKAKRSMKINGLFL